MAAESAAYLSQVRWSWQQDRSVPLETVSILPRSCTGTPGSLQAHPAHRLWLWSRGHILHQSTLFWYSL